MLAMSMKSHGGRLRFSGPAALVLLLGGVAPWSAPGKRGIADYDSLETLPPGASQTPSPKRSERAPVSIVTRAPARAGLPEAGPSRPAPPDRSGPIPPGLRPPCPASRLDLCAEYTKPFYLRIRLLGTPQNHRSPPA